MNVLFDTSVLVASTMQSHQDHAACRRWVEAAVGGRILLFVSCHSLAEFYRVLTSVKTVRQLSTNQVWRILADELLKIATVVELTQTDYIDCLSRLASANERGGIVFDAIIVQAALKAHVDKLLTLNDKHFRRIWPNHTDEVINPLTMQAP